MEVILLDKVEHLGQLGDQVEVKSGYARNFLIPKGWALLATKKNIARFEAMRVELKAKLDMGLAEAQVRADQISALGSLSISAKAGQEGKLFGSIGPRDIADAVMDAGVPLIKAEVRLLEGSIRHVGEYQVNFQLHPEVIATLNVRVIPQ